MARKEKGGGRVSMASFVKIQHHDEKVDLGIPQRSTDKPRTLKTCVVKSKY